jgi:predicted  nucleic acid-binding Zn-ribbon protein
MIRGLLIGMLIFVTGCAANNQTVRKPEGQSRNADNLLVIDCQLPGQVRKLGQNLTYLTPRRAIKTTAVDCEIRGGEYVAYDRANYKTALNIWLPQAQQGDPIAQTYVGEIYEKGLGIEADYAIAAHWYQQAAEQGYARAQINLGYLYEGGLGVPRDLTKAMNWYRKASGLTDGDLEYVSSIEIANREAARSQSAQLKQEVEKLRGELGQTRKLLQRRKSALSTAERELDELRKEFEARKQSLRVTPVLTSSSNPGTPIAASDSERGDLTQELQDARQEQQRLISKLATQQLEANRLRQDLEESHKQLDVRRNEFKQAYRKLEQMRAELNRLKMTESPKDNSETIRNLDSKTASLQTKLNSQQQEITRLENEKQQQYKKLIDELNALHQKERQLEQALKARNEKIAALQTRLSNETKAQTDTELQNQLASAQQQVAKSEQTQADLKALEQELRRRENEIVQQKEEIAQLQTQLEKEPGKLERSDFAVVVATKPVGPTIEVIDPPLSVTRGMPAITLRSKVPQIEIIGRVLSTDELLTFRINDKNQNIDKNGLFKVSMPVKEPKTPVSLVAIDKSGSRSAIDFVIIPKQVTAASAADKEIDRRNSKEASDINFGEYHALIIGNNDYVYLTDLTTAVNDAKAVEEILRSKYGFKTQLLLNANRYAMLSALNQMRETLTENDSLLIYYAGHGELDDVNLRGHWLPTDAEPESDANWISNVAITDILNVMSAKHVLVVADSCYSGAMTRSSLARLQPGISTRLKAKWYKTMVLTRTRVALTSGGLQPVLDRGGGEHSIFAKAFLEVLAENDEVLEGYRLYRAVYERVKQTAEKLHVDQEPQYAPIKYAGHEAGEFFLLPNTMAGYKSPGILTLAKHTHPANVSKNYTNLLAWNMSKM